MATVVRNSGNKKEEAAMDEIVHKFDPLYRDSSKAAKRDDLKKALLGHFQLSLILEHTVAERSKEIRKIPLINVDTKGMDFDDGSDLKFVRLTPGTGTTEYKKKTGEIQIYSTNYAKGNITNMNTKKGAIRLIIWNEVLNMLEFYFIPAERVSSLVNAKKDKGVINFSGGYKSGVIRKFEDFRVETFDDLVMA